MEPNPDMRSQRSGSSVSVASVTSRDRMRFPRTCLVIALNAAMGCAGAAAETGSGTTADPSVDALDRVAPDQLYQRGELLARSGDMLRAEQYVSVAVQRGYPERAALPLLLRVCVASSRFGLALQHANPYLQHHPDDYRLRYLVAAVQLGMNRTDAAQRELERVLRDAPEYADAHYLLGVILRDHGDEVGAAAHFDAQQRLDPNGLHGAEVAAWLRERAFRREQAVTGPAADSAQIPVSPSPESMP
jgi:tetratricopeptide (TPR) repeat protein